MIANSPAYFTLPITANSISTQSEKHGDRLLARLIEILAPTKSSVELMPVSRIIDALSNSRPICFFAASGNLERSRITYAARLSISPAVNVIIRKETLAKFPQWENGVALADILHRPGIIGQHTQSTSFGIGADRLIRAAQGNSNLTENPLAHPANQIRMLLEKRVDYVLDYRNDLESVIESGAAPADQLVTLLITDIPRTTDTYVLCPKDSWGLSAIRAIDRGLQKMAGEPLYREATLSEFPTSTRALYGANIEHFLAERGQPQTEWVIGQSEP